MKVLPRLTLAAVAAGVLLAGVVPGAADEKKDEKKPAAKTEKAPQKADPHAALLGKPAPDIRGEFAINGQAMNLSGLKGKVVLVDFWAVWCGPCIATFPHLRDWQKEYHDKGLEILGVTTYWERFGFDKEKGKLQMVGKAEKDETTGKAKLVGGLDPMAERAMVKDFAAHHKLQHELLLVSKDGWKAIGDDYKVRGIPTAVLIDRKGVVRMVRVGSGPENATALEAEIKKLVAE